MNCQRIGEIRQGMITCLMCGKYWFLLKDFCLHSLSRRRYRFGQAPSIIRQFEKQIKKENEKKDDDVKKSSWFSL